MQNGLRLGRLTITPGFLLLCALVCIFEPQPLVVYFLAAALLHELGHIAVLCAVGGRVESLTLAATGAVLDCGIERLSYARELVVCAAGAAANLGAASIFALLGRITSAQPLYILAGANIALAVFNLLPAYALDGGRVVKTLCLMLFDRETLLPRILNALVVGALLVLCVWMLLNGGFNVALVWMAAWVLRLTVNT